MWHVGMGKWKIMAAGGANVSDLLASAFSAQLDSTVVSYKKYKKEKDDDGRQLCYELLDIDRLTSATCMESWT